MDELPRGFLQTRPDHAYAMRCLMLRRYYTRRECHDCTYGVVCSECAAQLLKQQGVK